VPVPAPRGATCAQKRVLDGTEVLPTSPKVISDNDDLEHNLLIGNIKTVPDKIMATKAK
jgi:hypothetical protein